MKRCIEGSLAVAETIKLCKPAVVAAYPITPQTHIVEELAKFKAEDKADFEFIRAESEFSAASIVLGASASGVHIYRLKFARTAVNDRSFIHNRRFAFASSSDLRQPGGISAD